MMAEPHALHPGAVAQRCGARPAVIVGNDMLSYAALDAQSAAGAARLYAHGLRAGDVVALLAGNAAAWLAAAWAAQRSGLYLLAVPARATHAELAYLLADAGAAALVHDEARAAVAAGAGAPLTLALSQLLSPCDAPPAPALEGGDLLYTSGTTGRPKGVKRPLSLAPLGSEARRVERARALFGLGDGSVLLSPAPFYHAAPLRFAMNLLRTGGTLVGMARFDAAEALALIGRHRVTHSQWVPTMLARLLALPDDVRRAADFSSHTLAFHGGGPCPPHVKRALIDWWGPIVHEYYSGTESIGFTHATSADWLARPGTVGRAVGCRIHILDDAGRELPANTPGHVHFSGSGQPAYHNAPEKAAAATSPQGWGTMGDIGHVDADGFLFLTDRRAFTIISGGVNIYPREVEDALLALAEVADCAVFGVPDDDLGEAVMAVVEPAEPAAAGPALADVLQAALAGVLSPIKRPRHIRFEAIARSETGKLDKAALRARWSATMAREPA
jgi:acyl-CoA synthetase (AMP-forming)/AMP-acid ligase II